MMYKKSIIVIIITMTLTACTYQNETRVSELEELLKESTLELDRAKKEIVTQEDVIETLNKEIVTLEENNKNLNEQLDAITNTNEEIKSLDIDTQEYYYNEDSYQNIVGVKFYNSNEPLMMFPYSDLPVVTNLGPSEVRVISTGVNKDKEQWALVEALSVIAWNRYGYVKTDYLSDKVEGKFDYDSLDIGIKIGDIKIGDMTEEVIEKYGKDYAVIKDGNGHVISYDNDEHGSGLDIILDSRVSKVRGIRACKEGYLTTEGFGVGDNVLEPYNYYKSIYPSNEDVEYRVIFGLENGYTIHFQIDTEFVNEYSKIKKIILEPDWMGIFR